MTAWGLAASGSWLAGTMGLSIPAWRAARCISSQRYPLTLQKSRKAGCDGRFVKGGEERHVARIGLDELERIFSDFGLFRCHQSYLVPLGRIRQVRQAEFGRTLCAVLDTGEKIPVSREKYALLRENVGI